MRAIAPRSPGSSTTPSFDPSCPTKIDFAGTTHAYVSLRNQYNPARTGRILVDAGRGNVIRYEEEAAGFSEKFGKERGTVRQSWDFVKIG